MRKVAKEHPAVKEVLLEFYNDRIGCTEKKRAEVGMEERRRNPRLKEKVPVRIEPLPQSTLTGEVTAKSWHAVSVDISESGVVVGISGASQEAFHVEGEVRLELELPEKWGTLSTAGTVRRVKPALTDENMILVGVEYVNMTDAATKKIKEFLYGEDHLEE
jgi:c-di-GMP-binding flagellar brake protein YcgR